MNNINSLILSNVNNQTCPISDVTGERIDKGNYKYIMTNRCFRFTNTEFQNPYYYYTFDYWYSIYNLNYLNYADPYYCTSLKNQSCLSKSNSFNF
jgi:hypothetical protein